MSSLSMPLLGEKAKVSMLDIDEPICCDILNDMNDCEIESSDSDSMGSHDSPVSAVDAQGNAVVQESLQMYKAIR